MLDIEKITVSNYGEYSSDNYGVHCLKFTDGTNTYWFSYKTLVAFRINGEFHIIKNYWGTTTGKHLNWICTNKSIREDEDSFNKNYKKCISRRY